MSIPALRELCPALASLESGGAGAPAAQQRPRRGPIDAVQRAEPVPNAHQTGSMLQQQQQQQQGMQQQRSAAEVDMADVPREGGDGNLFAVAVGPHFGIFDGWAAASTEGYSGPVYKKLVVKQRSTKVDGISTFRTRAEAREAGLVYLESEAARRGLEAEQAAVGAAGTRG